MGGSTNLKADIRRHRRTEDNAGHPAELDVGSLHLDLVHCEATLGGRSLDLTPREFDFLAYLARYAGKVCTRRMIPENVWGPGYGRPARSLDDLLGEITPTFAAT
ncbi:MAG: winged helix-turn-helix domain-containing protein [Streptosporangiaceae bacterium]|jgi:two-component system KDP operon response regulator KdpE